jgi:hypothetical protein
MLLAYIVYMKTKYLRQRIEDLGLTPDKFADLVGVKPVTMRQNYLRGICPNKSVALLMKDTLKCDYDDFLYPDELEELDLGSEAAS